MCSFWIVMTKFGRTSGVAATPAGEGPGDEPRGHRSEHQGSAEVESQCHGAADKSLEECQNEQQHCGDRRNQPGLGLPRTENEGQRQRSRGDVEPDGCHAMDIEAARVLDVETCRSKKKTEGDEISQGQAPSHAEKS